MSPRITAVQLGDQLQIIVHAEAVSQGFMETAEFVLYREGAALVARELGLQLVILPEPPLANVIPMIPGAAIVGFSPARAAGRRTVAA